MESFDEALRASFSFAALRADEKSIARKYSSLNTLYGDCQELDRSIKQDELCLALRRIHEWHEGTAALLFAAWQQLRTAIDDKQEPLAEDLEGKYLNLQRDMEGFIVHFWRRHVEKELARKEDGKEVTS